MSTTSSTTLIWRGLLSLVVLAVLAFTLQAVVFSGASFTASSVNPANMFTAGILTHTTDRDGYVMIAASGLMPGVSETGSLRLTDGGNVPGRFTLSASGLTDTPGSPKLSDVLTLTVEDVTGTATTLYQGSVSAFSAVDLGTIAPGDVRSYQFTLAYPAGTADAALQGAALSLGLRITGVSL
jgi:hypothetical protein